MSMAQMEERDIGAEVISPLFSLSEFRLPAKINASVAIENGFVIALGDGSLHRLTRGDGEQVAPLDAFRHSAAATRLVPMGKGFVSAGQDGKVIAWQDSPTPVIDFTGHWVDALSVHPASGLIAAASRGNLVVADMDGNKLAEQKGFPSSISGLAFAEDGKRVAVSHLDGVSVITVENGQCDLKLEWKGSQTGITWSPDGRYLVTTTQERELHVWDLVTMQDFRMGGYPNKVHDLCWSKDGNFLFCTGADVITAWAFAGAGPAGKPPIEMGYVYNGLVSAVAAHPEKNIAAGGYSTGAVLLGGVARGEALVARHAGQGEITTLCWAPDGKSFIAGSSSGEVVLVRLQDEPEL